MSEGAQALYLHLGLNTDTIGALTGARRLAGSFGLSDPDGAFSELVSKGYLIEAEQDCFASIGFEPFPHRKLGRPRHPVTKTEPP